MACQWLPTFVELSLRLVVAPGYALPSKLLHPRPQLDLPGPSAVRLMQDVQIGRGNRVRIEHARLPIGRLRPALALDPAVNDEMRDMDALRAELARHALRQTAQRELAHGEWGRKRVALHAC